MSKSTKGQAGVENHKSDMQKQKGTRQACKPKQRGVVRNLKSTGLNNIGTEEKINVLTGMSVQTEIIQVIHLEP